MAPSDHLLRTFAAVPPSTRVLDAGCGGGRHLVPLAILGFEVYGCDTDAAAIEAANVQLRTETGVDAGNRLTGEDAAHLSHADDFFGWIVACGLLDRYSDAERLALLGELRRVLVPGGWLYVTWGGDADALVRLFTRSGFAVAEAPQFDEREGATRAIFRRIEAGTVG